MYNVRSTKYEKGAALVLAFGLMLIVIALAVASVVFIDLQRSFAENLVKNTQNYYLAEAGYVYAWKTLFDARSNGLDPASLSPIELPSEMIEGVTKRVKVTVTVLDKSGTSGHIDQWKLESGVE